MYYAHIRADETKQTVEAHLNGTAERCASFAAAFGEEQRGKLLGYAHDIGKCSKAFQHRLQGGPKVDHATAGGLECAKVREILFYYMVCGLLDISKNIMSLQDHKRRDASWLTKYIWHIFHRISGNKPLLNTVVALHNILPIL